MRLHGYALTTTFVAGVFLVGNAALSQEIGMRAPVLQQAPVIRTQNLNLNLDSQFRVQRDLQMPRVAAGGSPPPREFVESERHASVCSEEGVRVSKEWWEDRWDGGHYRRIYHPARYETHRHCD